MTTQQEIARNTIAPATSRDGRRGDRDFNDRHLPAQAREAWRAAWVAFDAVRDQEHANDCSCRRCAWTMRSFHVIAGGSLGVMGGLFGGALLGMLSPYPLLAGSVAAGGFLSFGAIGIGIAGVFKFAPRRAHAQRREIADHLIRMESVYPVAPLLKTHGSEGGKTLDASDGGKPHLAFLDPSDPNPFIRSHPVWYLNATAKLFAGTTSNTRADMESILSFGQAELDLAASVNHSLSGLIDPCRPLGGRGESTPESLLRRAFQARQGLSDRIEEGQSMLTDAELGQRPSEALRQRLVTLRDSLSALDMTTALMPAFDNPQVRI